MLVRARASQDGNGLRVSGSAREHVNGPADVHRRSAVAPLALDARTNDEPIFIAADRDTVVGQHIECSAAAFRRLDECAHLEWAARRALEIVNRAITVLVTGRPDDGER